MRRLLILWLFLWLGTAIASDGDGIARIERLPESATLPADATVQQLQAAKFATAKAGQVLQVKGARSGWWRITPSADDDQSEAMPAIADSGERLLTVYNTYIADVTVLSAPDYRPRTQNLFDPALDSRYSRRALVYPLAGRGTSPIYLHLAGVRGDPPWVTVPSASGYAVADLHYTRIIYTLQAMLATVALIVLLFWIRLRERVYLLFTATIAFQLLFFMANTGEAYALPGLRLLGAYGAHGNWLLTTLELALTMFFINDFAELKRYVPRLSRFIVGAGFVLLAMAVLLLSPWPAQKEWFPVTSNVLVIAILLSLLAALVLTVWRGGRDSTYVLLAFTPLVATGIARAYQVQQGLRYQTWLEFGLPLALAFGAVILTYGLAVRMLSFRHERDQALRSADLDPLTGAINHSAGLRRVTEIAHRARAELEPLSLLFLDLDHFKRLNDEFGHLHGDACLRALVAAIGRELRQNDVLARFGGEEFVVLLPGTALEHAALVAERIRRRVQTSCQTIAGQESPLTVSIGVASLDRDNDRDSDLIKRGDTAMYRAKAEGRNRAVVGTLGADGQLAFVPADAVGKTEEAIGGKAEAVTGEVAPSTEVKAIK